MSSSLLLHSLTILGCLALASGHECNATGNCTERSDSTSQLLMVFGGAPYLEMVEVVSLISLDGDPPVPECLTNLNPFPTLMFGACGASLTDGKMSKYPWKFSFSHHIQDPGMGSN